MLRALVARTLYSTGCKCFSNGSIPVETEGAGGERRAKSPRVFCRLCAGAGRSHSSDALQVRFFCLFETVPIRVVKERVLPLHLDLCVLFVAERMRTVKSERGLVTNRLEFAIEKRIRTNPESGRSHNCTDTQ